MPSMPSLSRLAAIEKSSKTHPLNECLQEIRQKTHEVFQELGESKVPYRKENVIQSPAINLLCLDLIATLSSIPTAVTLPSVTGRGTLRGDLWRAGALFESGDFKIKPLLFLIHAIVNAKTDYAIWDAVEQICRIAVYPQPQRQTLENLSRPGGGARSRKEKEYGATNSETNTVPTQPLAAQEARNAAGQSRRKRTGDETTRPESNRARDTIVPSVEVENRTAASTRRRRGEKIISTCDVN